MSKKKSGCSKKKEHSGHRAKKDGCEKKSEKCARKHEKKLIKRASRELARAYFLDGETGAWAKRLAATSAPTGPAPTSTAPTGPAPTGPDFSHPASVDLVADPVLHAMASRRSISRVGPETPSDADLRELIRAVSSVADHKALRPWRFVIIRGDDRIRLGEAFDEAAGEKRKGGKTNEKVLRSELILALVSSPKPSAKVPDWEQHATSAGAGHLLELALWQAGWGVMWRTGHLTNAKAVRKLHGLKKSDLLMGWFHIGSVPENYRRRLATSTRPLPKVDQFLTTL